MLAEKQPGTTVAFTLSRTRAAAKAGDTFRQRGGCTWHRRPRFVRMRAVNTDGGSSQRDVDCQHVTKGVSRVDGAGQPASGWVWDGVFVSRCREHIGSETPAEWRSSRCSLRYAREVSL
jgi:hypothetical protein